MLFFNMCFGFDNTNATTGIAKSSVYQIFLGKISMKSNLSKMFNWRQRKKGIEWNNKDKLKMKNGGISKRQKAVIKKKKLNICIRKFIRCELSKRQSLRQNKKKFTDEVDCRYMWKIPFEMGEVVQ